MQDRAACSWTLRPARVMSPDSISRRLHIIAILKFVELWKDNERSLSRSFRRHHDSRFVIVSRGEFLSSCFFELFEIVNVNLFRRYKGIISKDWKEFYRRDWLIFPFFLRLYECLQNFTDILELFLRELRQKFSSLTDLKISFLIFFKDHNYSLSFEDTFDRWKVSKINFFMYAESEYFFHSNRFISNHYLTSKNSIEQFQ